MAPKLSLSIPTPCHEDWNTMTPEMQGRFCGQCNKTVLDFTLMKDGQILDALKKEKGNTCGRFTNDQLERPLIPPPKPKWYATGLWKYIVSIGILSKAKAANAQAVNENENTVTCYPTIKKQNIGKLAVATTTALIKYKITILNEDDKAVPFANVNVKSTNKSYNANADGKLIVEAIDGDNITINSIGSIEKVMKLTDTNTVVKLTAKKSENCNITVTLGMVSNNHDYTYYEQKSSVIYTILDITNQQPLPGATVVINRNGKAETLIADKHGSVKIKRIKEHETITVTVSNIGYQETTTTLNGNDLKNGRNKLSIALQQKITKAEDVVVVIAGGVIKRKGNVSCVSPKEKDTFTKIKKFVDTVFNKTPSFKIYPNPIVGGGSATINYNSQLDEFVLIQLFGADGKWIMQQKHKVIKGENIIQFNMPNQLAAQQASISIMNSVGKNIGTQQVVIVI